MEGRPSQAITRSGLDADNLHRYSRLKLELAATIRSSLDRARRRKDGEIESRARRLLARLSEDRFYLAVVGQHKRGKSSLMNAMIGRDLLPTGVLPVTSAIVALRYDSELHIGIRHKGSNQLIGIKLDQLRDYVSEQGNPGNRKQIEAAEVGVPAELLRYGFYFVDTPGIGSAVAANTATTEAFLPEADAAVFVTSFDSPMNEMELEFLDKVRAHVHKMFFAINKSDLVSAEEREQVMHFVRERIQEHTGQTDVKVYSVSAMRQLAAVAGHSGNMPDPGMEELRTDLQSYLTTEKAGEFLLGVAGRARQILVAERMESNLAQWTDTTRAQSPSIEAELASTAEQLKNGARQIVEDLRPTVSKVLSEQIATVFPSFRDTHVAPIEREIAALFSGSLLLPLFALSDRLAEIRGKVESTGSQWLQDNVVKFEGAIRSATASQAEPLANVAGSVLKVFATHLNIGPSVQDGPPEQNLIVSTSPANPDNPVSETALRLPAEGPDFEWNWRPSWWCYLVPVVLIRAALVRHATHSFEDAIRDYATGVTATVLTGGERWADDLELGLDSSINRRTAEIRSMLATKASSSVAEVDAEIVKLDDLSQDLRHVETNDIRGEAETEDTRLGGPVSLEPCVICRELIDALGSFLAKFQYDLAVNEASQRNHAERGGFCPLHTWIYEGIASPQGMSSGYAATVELAAQRLRAVAENSTNARLPSEVDTVVAFRARCAACEMLTIALRDLIAVRASEIDRGGRPSLCLPHAMQTLVKVGDPAQRRALLVDRSQALDRIAEDMRRFALKNEALRHHLTVGDEVRAYVKGLQQLAGLKNLSMALRVD